MEPRARAGKNVGKMTFNHNELAQLLYGHGDVKNCLPETVRVLDEMATEFIQGVAFDAARTAHHAGRQKVKFEDFEFAMRKNTVFMGKIRETFEKKREIDRARHIMNEDDAILREANKAERKAAKAAARAAAKAEAAAAAAAATPATAGGGAALGLSSVLDQDPDPDLDMGEGGQTEAERNEEELGEADDDAQAEADALGTGAKRRRLE